MKRFQHPLMIFALLACFMFVSSALSSQAADHSTHHTHHKASTHTSNICSWMCAAGHILQSVDFELRVPMLATLAFENVFPSSVDLLVSRFSQSRAPPF
ncbi:MAG: hypothetical protein MRJ96_15630 [Nitrospirales bacterium]|nr:hypothetical protein [Nitrospirales bacterium]